MASSVSKWFANFSSGYHNHVGCEASSIIRPIYPEFCENTRASELKPQLPSNDKPLGSLVHPRQARSGCFASEDFQANDNGRLLPPSGKKSSVQSTLQCNEFTFHSELNDAHPRIGCLTTLLRLSSSIPGTSSSIATLYAYFHIGTSRSVACNAELACSCDSPCRFLAQDTTASLGPLFTCISPYMSSADVRLDMPLKRLYDPRGPVVFPFPPMGGMQLHRGELRLWQNESERIVSQNSSNRRVHRALWTSSIDPQLPRPAALKFVEDANPRDGRSLKREIECHIYVYQKLPCLFQMEQELRAGQADLFSFVQNREWSVAERIEDAWPSAELFGYHLDKKNPGKSVLLTRKLSGPDLFDVIRAEHNHNWHFHHPQNSNSAGSHQKCRNIYSHKPSARTLTVKENQFGSLISADESCAYYPLNYEYHKLRWCALALKRIAQYAALSIRHNDVKPDNIVLDFHTSRMGHECLDVKLIDLGTASMHNAKDFTGGTSWYESPEQKLLEYFMKRRKCPEAAKRVEIDLTSDLWGAGISLAEILVGRRVVDSLKAPHGPGSLEYLGWEMSGNRAQARTAGEESGQMPLEADCHGVGGHLSSYPFWAIDPADWILCAGKALGLDKENRCDKICIEAAKWVFTHLVRPNPESRTPLNVAMGRLERFAEEAYKRFKHVSAGAGQPETNFDASTTCILGVISPETTSASTPTAIVPSCDFGSSHRQELLRSKIASSSMRHPGLRSDGLSERRVGAPGFFSASPGPRKYCV